jgi:hypothetical protein
MSAVAVAEITTKQDMARWTRAHADAPRINWSVFAGPGGTLVIVEREGPRGQGGDRDAASR